MPSFRFYVLSPDTAKHRGNQTLTCKGFQITRVHIFRLNITNCHTEFDDNLLQCVCTCLLRSQAIACSVLSVVCSAAGASLLRGLCIYCPLSGVAGKVQTYVNIIFTIRSGSIHAKTLLNQNFRNISKYFPLCFCF